MEARTVVLLATGCVLCLALHASPAVHRWNLEAGRMVVFLNDLNDAYNDLASATNEYAVHQIPGTLDLRLVEKRNKIEAAAEKLEERAKRFLNQARKVKKASRDL